MYQINLLNEQIMTKDVHNFCPSLRQKRILCPWGLSRSAWFGSPLSQVGPLLPLSVNNPSLLRAYFWYDYSKSYFACTHYLQLPIGMQQSKKKWYKTSTIYYFSQIFVSTGFWWTVLLLHIALIELSVFSQVTLGSLRCSLLISGTSVLLYVASSTSTEAHHGGTWTITILLDRFIQGKMQKIQGIILFYLSKWTMRQA
jgi:hypothetical protein